MVQYYSLLVGEKLPLVLEEEEPVLVEKPPLDKEESPASAKIVSL
jgi:hypothetical protein